jgi:diguanylate cyclase (GGDEF)-like protein
MSTTLTPKQSHAFSDAPLLQALLGPPGPTRQAVKRMLWLLPSYWFAGAMLILGVHMDRIPAAPAWALAAYATFGLFTFYLLLRSGWAARRRDPTLAFPQVLFSISAVLITYATIDVTRVLVLQWLCLILAFDMHRLSKRQVQAATLIAMAGLSTIIGHALLTTPGKYNVVGEMINIVMASLSMPILVLVSGLARRLRKQSEKQKADMAEALSQMQALAIRDGLTRSLTRRYMQQMLEEEVARQRRTGRVFCIAMLDIDLFKKVNDKHGHAVGDAVLIDFAHLAQDEIDKGHKLGRWGGEEFMVLMPDTNLAHAIETLALIHEAVHAHNWAAHAPDLKVTFSGGVSQHLLNDKLDDTIQSADEALYAAKKQGRDRVLTSDQLTNGAAAT